MLSSSLNNDILNTSITNDANSSTVDLGSLRYLRNNNINKIIIASLNINSLPNKFDDLKLSIQQNIDILVITETKLDDSFPTSQFLIEGYQKPFRLDRNRNGGGILIYTRDHLPCKEVNAYQLPHDIEGIFVEIILKKCKWLMLRSYHPPCQNDQYYSGSLSKSF